MHRLLIATALLSTAAAAAPAAAQYAYPGDDRYYNYDNGRAYEVRIDRLRDRVERSIDRGRLSPREAQYLRREAWQLDRLYDRYRRNGLTRNEAYDLDRRINALQQRLRYERRDDRRYRDPRDGYRDHDRYDRYDRDDRDEDHHDDD